MYHCGDHLTRADGERHASRMEEFVAIGIHHPCQSFGFMSRWYAGPWGFLQAGGHED